MPPAQKTIGSTATPIKDWKPMLVGLALVIVTVTAFWQLKECGFINLDDNKYVYENNFIQSGLNAGSIQAAFSFDLARMSGHWCPMTWLSWMLDFSIFGLNPTGFHLVNLFFHILNTILLFLVLRRMTKSLWPSAFVAALFAIHPLHVESVAWITERKDVLSTFFFMLTLGAYSYYVEHPGFKRYVFVLLFFVLGLLSKSMLVTLPFVLMLLDYWPLNRFSEIAPSKKIMPESMKFGMSAQFKRKNKKKQTAGVKQPLQVQKPAEPQYSWPRIFSLLWEKVPLFVLAILFSVTAYFAAQSAEAVHSLANTPLDLRIGNAFIAYISYMAKLIWPVNLGVFYPYPKFLVTWQVLGSGLLLIVITSIVIWKAKKLPYLVTGWLWYLTVLVPVIGIVQAGSQARADRYTYISLIGLFIILAWGVPDILKKLKYWKEILMAASVLVLLGLSGKTWIQVGYWKNNFTLFDHTLKVTDYNWVCYNGRGLAHDSIGNHLYAIEDFNRAIEINPGYGDAYMNRGNSYCRCGRYNQALEDFNIVIKNKPGFAEAFNNRGFVYHSLGDYKQAIGDYNKAIEIKPDYLKAYANRALAYVKIGNENLAINDLKMVARLGDESTRIFLRSQGISW